MNAAETVRYIKAIQSAFAVIATLQLTAYYWPEQAVVEDNATFDFIIAGAGTSGCVLATRLVEDKKISVLLIEAGRDPPIESTIPSTMLYLDKTYLDWGYTSECDACTYKCHKNRTVDLLVGKMLGGTSSLSFLLYYQGYYKDYDNWAKIVCDSTWNWKNVLPYFIKAERLEVSSKYKTITKDVHGFKGLLGITKEKRLDNKTYLSSLKEMGNKLVFDINGEDFLGYSPFLYPIAKRIRQSTAYSYLRTVKKNPNLKVLKNTVVKKIIFDENNNAIGVEAVSENRETLTFKARKEVIVSTGAIKSPQLLMLSGIGPKEHLESKGIKVISDLPVGKNYHDHISTIIIHNMTKETKDGPIRPLIQYPAIVFIGNVNLNKTKDYPEYSTVSFINYAKYLMEYCTWTYGLQDDICDPFFAAGNTNQMLFTFVTNLKPKSRGEILLQSDNYEDAPIVKTGFYSRKKDLENQVKYIKDFVRITNTSFFKKAGGELVNPKPSSCANERVGSTAYWKCYALCVNAARRYYVGTCAMGAVVDSKLRVKGVQRLRVVDASIIPVITSGGTYMPTVMIGEKTADFIKEDYKLIKGYD